MAERAEKDVSVSRRALWFGLLGGAVAWTLHILLAAVIAEWGCTSPAPSIVLGAQPTVLMLFIVTLATLILAVSATFVAYRAWGRAKFLPADYGDPRGTSKFMSKAGVIMSGLFVFIILVQSVPILYFLTSC